MRAYGLALVLGLCGALSSMAPSRADPLIGEPVYFPGTKSYFELARIDDLKYLNSERGMSTKMWPGGESIARKMVYKGVAGRLAVVKDLDTHEFLQRTFRPDTFAWIGLRYWCNGKLQYDDGTFWHPGEFHAWDSQWDKSGLVDACEDWHVLHKPTFMPVAYSPFGAGAGNGFRWIANGARKGYDLILVEFPTGKP